MGTKSKALLAAEAKIEALTSLLAESEAECTAKLEAMQVQCDAQNERIEAAKVVFRAQKAEIEALKVGKTRNHVTYYVDRSGQAWMKTRTGNNASSTKVDSIPA